MYQPSRIRRSGDDAKIKIVTSEPESKPRTPRSPKRYGESLIAWFDRNCEKELQRHRAQLNVSLDTATAVPKGITIDQRVCGGLDTIHPTMLSQSCSGIDIASKLRGERDTELLDAIEKLAKAEAMVAFEGAVRAAEQAAAQVPPEYAEEAAAASARSYQAELTAVIKDDIVQSRIRPIEVIGYVGITRPKKPRKSRL